MSPVLPGEDLHSSLLSNLLSQDFGNRCEETSRVVSVTRTSIKTRKQTRSSRDLNARGLFLFSICCRPFWRLQNETLSSLKALLKHIDQSQLTRDLEGSFHYDHSHWIHFRQVGVTSLSELGAERPS